MGRCSLLWAGLIIVFCLLGLSLLAQKVQKAQKASAVYSMRVENNITWDEAVRMATQRAQIKAIEDVFGRVILQDNSTFVKNEQNGTLVKTNSTFNFISNSYIKGEWVEDIDDPKIEKLSQDGETWIKVTVNGRVREVVAPQNSFDSYTINCTEQKCKTQVFNDGQDLFVYFKSPEDGFLSIYLTDPSVQYTFLLLPYKNAITNKKCVKVSADKEYIFFSKQFDYFGDMNSINEQVASVSPDHESEKYQLWLIFSPEMLEKPVLEDESITTKKFLDEASIKRGYTLQKGTTTQKFMEWMQDYRLHNKRVQLSTLFFDVNKM